MSLIHNIKKLMQSRQADERDQVRTPMIPPMEIMVKPSVPLSNSPKSAEPESEKAVEAVMAAEKASENNEAAAATAESGDTPDSEVIEAAAYPHVIHNLQTDGITKTSVGRKQAFDHIMEGLEKAHYACVIADSATVSNQGGVGKTQLALEISWEVIQRRTHRAVLYVPAYDSEKIYARLASLVKESILNLPEREDVFERNRLEGTLRWLQAQQDWVLIFDGADTADAQMAIIDLLPKLQNGKVIVTSRLSNWSESFELFHLESLALKEGCECLLRETDAKRKKMPNDAIIGKEVIRVFSGNPLALHLVACFLNAKQTSLAYYLNKGQFEGLNGSEEDLPGLTVSMRNFEKALLFSLKALRPEGKTLLKVLAYFAETSVSYRLLEQELEVLKEAHRVACKLNNKRASMFSLDRALKELERMGLVSWNGERITVQRFVISFLHPRLFKALTAQQKLSLEENPAKNYALIAALKILHTAAKADPRSGEDLELWQMLNPHIEKVIDFCDQAGQIDKTKFLMSQWALFLKSKGHVDKAEELYRRVSSICQQKSAKDDPQVAVCLNNLAQILSGTKRYQEAEELMVHVIEVFEELHGARHPYVAKALSNLAKIMQATHRHDVAENLVRQALEIDEAHYGACDEEVEARVIQLAGLLKSQARFDEAEVLVRRAIYSVGKRRFGHCSLTVNYLNQLGEILMMRGAYNEAEKTYQKALRIGRKVFGQEALKLSDIFHSLSRLFLMSGRWEEAKRATEHLISVHEKGYGELHPSIVKHLKVLVGILKTQKNIHHAIALQERVLNLEERLHGVISVEMASAMSELAKLYQSLGRKTEADKLLERARTIYNHLKPKGPSGKGDLRAAVAGLVSKEISVA